MYEGQGGQARGSCTKSLLSRPDDLSKPQSESPQHRSLLQKCLLRLQPRRRATKPAAPSSVPEPRVKITVSEYNSTSDNTGFSSV
ncbi:hypothetical protein B566_EDAN008574 [Ephemera danica]|nr:hypothetical protein B566_EDAN008574 [Ephemera danica]